MRHRVLKMEKRQGEAAGASKMGGPGAVGNQGQDMAGKRSRNNA